jgi:hypothetical protein
MNKPGETSGRSKRAQGSGVSAVVEQQRGTGLYRAACATECVTILDTRVCRGQTALTPFQILLSECADAHPCC